MKMERMCAHVWSPSFFSIPAQELANGTYCKVKQYYLKMKLGPAPDIIN